jgi:hypothetical protein
MEHRWGERLRVALPVRIRAACGLVGTGLVLDFSVSGAFVATTLPAALFSRIRVSIASEHRPARRMRAPGTMFEGMIVRHDSAGFAVEWCDFGAEEVVAFVAAQRPGGLFVDGRAVARAADLASSKHPAVRASAISDRSYDTQDPSLQITGGHRAVRARMVRSMLEPERELLRGIPSSQAVPE